MRLLMIVLLALAFAGSQAGDATQRADSPSTQNEWRQFRGNPHLTGVSSIVLPATLTLAWTYEAGESIESSAAIVDGTVFVGSQSGELVALDL
ncbi:MAG: PQQ-binding-like beta-propeller repeat protein, partial [Candidatus Acidoferrales bacterium]